jgi:WD40 repeat protein
MGNGCKCVYEKMKTSKFLFGTLVLALFSLVSCAKTSVIYTPTTPPQASSTFTKEAMQPTRTEKSTVLASSTATQTSVPATHSPTPFKLSQLAFAPENDARIDRLTTLNNSPIGVIEDLAWQPGGQMLAVIGSYGVALLDTNTWEWIWQIPYSSKYPELMFNVQGNLLVIMDGYGYASFVDVEAREVLKEVLVEGNFAISPDGRLVASTVGGHIHLLDWQTGQEIGLLQSRNDLGAIYDLAFSADGKTVIAGSDMGGIQVWNVETLDRLFAIPADIPSQVYQCAIQGGMYGEPVGNLILNCSYPSKNYVTIEHQIYLWNADRQSQFLISPGTSQSEYWDLVIDSNRQRLALFSQGGIEIWHANGKLEKTLAGIKGNGMSFHPESSDILAVWTDQSIQIWDVSTGTLSQEFLNPGSIAPVLELAFDPKAPGRMLAVGREDGTVEIWDVTTGQRLALGSNTSSEISGLAYNADGSRLVIGHRYEGVSVWDTQGEPSLLTSFKLEMNLFALALHPNGKTVYCGGNTGQIEQWDLETQKKVNQWEFDNHHVYSLAVSPDGLFLAAGDNIGQILLIDNGKQEVLNELHLNTGEAIDSIVFNPDGDQLVAASGRSIQVWEISGDKAIRAWKSQENVTRLAYSPDQCILASGNAGAVDLFDSQKAKFYTSLNNRGSRVQSLAFSPEGYLLAVGGDHGNVLIWGVLGALEKPVSYALPKVRCPSIQPLPTQTPTKSPTAKLTPSSTPILSPTSTQSPTDTPTPPVFQRNLYLTSPAMHGDDVLALQERLVRLGYEEVGIPDGYFGQMTEQAVRHFQEINQLEVDGVVGMITWNRLFSSEAVGAP